MKGWSANIGPAQRKLKQHLVSKYDLLDIALETQCLSPISKNRMKTIFLLSYLIYGKMRRLKLDRDLRKDIF
jgi:hypothetical protein